MDNDTDRDVGGRQADILIVDDRPAQLLVYQTILEDIGQTLFTAASGEEALKQVLDRDFAAILLDVNMPGLNGIDTLRELRADPLLRSLPVIVATGSVEESDRLAGLDQGADDVVVKPVSLAELVARVRAQIRGHAAMADELKAGRKHRRQLAALLSELPRDADLLGLATALADRLPSAVGVDGVAIVAFERGASRCVAASSLLRDLFPPGRLVRPTVGTDIAELATAGAWLQAPDATRSDESDIELAFVPSTTGVPYGVAWGNSADIPILRRP